MKQALFIQLHLKSFLLTPDNTLKFSPFQDLLKQTRHPLSKMTLENFKPVLVNKFLIFVQKVYKKYRFEPLLTLIEEVEEKKLLDFQQIKTILVSLKAKELEIDLNSLRVMQKTPIQLEPNQYYIKLK
mmetsp:Transcript_19629/g.18710  ORF Transcript_19629/g.18710 Transcript_19629/m.18710 type:complete len:128 (-) Transcript_19629:140-523(-)